MELQHLRYFLDIARLESISRAAEKNHVAQPALSRVVSVLERELGTRLFDRVGRNIRLNESGKILFQAADQALALLDGVKEKIDYCNGQITGSVKLCMYAPVWEFAKLFQAFAQAYPLVELDAQRAADPEKATLNTDYDLFFHMGPARREGYYESCCLTRQEMVTVVHQNNPLAKGKFVLLRDLAHQELILPRYTVLRDMLTSYCYQAGFIPTIIGEVSLPAGQRNLMASTPERRALVLLGEDEITPYWGEEYRILPIREPICSVDLNMAWSSSAPLRPSVEAFRDFAMAYYREMGMEQG